MAEFLITMADNGKHLSHYGVKGQKWGVWNPETKARYEGVPVSGGGGSDEEEEEEITEKHFERDQEKELDAELKKLGVDPDNLDDKHNSWNDPFLNKLEAYWDRIDELGVSDKQKEQSSRMAASKQAEKRQAQQEEDRYNELKDTNPLSRTVEENEKFYDLEKKHRKAEKEANAVTHGSLSNKTRYLITMDTGEKFIAHAKYAERSNYKADTRSDISSVAPTGVFHAQSVKHKRQEQEPSKRSAIEAVNSKVSEAKEKAILEQHQKFRKEFLNNRKK